MKIIHPLLFSRKRLSLLFSLVPLLLCIPAIVHSQWESDRRLTFDSDSSMLSNNNARCIAASGDTVHVVWYDRRAGNWKIYYKRSNDAGTTWSSDTSLSSGPASSINPSIAVSGPNVHLVWQDNRGGNWEIYYKRSTDQGTSWGVDTRLTTDAGESATPSLAVSDSLLHLVWSDNRYGANKIFYKFSQNCGGSWFSDRYLTGSHPGSHSVPCISISAASVHLVYVRYDSMGSSVIYKRSTDTGATWFPDTVLHSASSGPNSGTSFYYPSLFVADSIVLFVDVTNSWYRTLTQHWVSYLRSLNGGLSWGGNIITSVTGAVYRSPAVWGCNRVTTFNVLVVWSDDRNGNNEIYHRWTFNGGISWSGEIRLTNDTSASITPFFAVQGPKVHVVWADNRDGNYEIYYKRNLNGNYGVEVNEVISPISRLPYSTHPNPFTSFVSVPGHSPERFALYDISGRKVGVYKGDRIGEGLSAGVYFLRPEGKDAKPLRVVKVR